MSMMIPAMRPETMGVQLDSMIQQAEGSTVALRGVVDSITREFANSVMGARYTDVDVASSEPRVRFNALNDNDLMTKVVAKIPPHLSDMQGF